MSQRPIGPGSAREGVASTFSTPARTHAQAVFMTLPRRAQPAAGPLHNRQQVCVLIFLYHRLNQVSNSGGIGSRSVRNARLRCHASSGTLLM